VLAGHDHWYQKWNRVSGSWVIGSTIFVGSSRVGSRVSVSDPMCDPFSATVSETVHRMLSDPSPYSVCPACLAQATLCYMTTPLPPKRGHSTPNVGPYLLWPNGWMNQDEIWHGGRPRPRPHCVRWDPAPAKMEHTPTFRPMFIVAKRSSISATAEHLLSFNTRVYRSVVSTENTISAN